LVKATATRLATDLKATLSPWTVLGPAPAFIPRIAHRHRWQILVKGPAGREPWPDLTYLHARCPQGVSLTLDVDPLELL
ncbi:MAG: hypothetical protein IGQ88_08715, partial [Gloeomargaritaceae cyanobacterium C42_A2020_066]|nr:hypothetical protein [Gloeomargaritaceae cyanobacterium C42_A2020_066]